MIKIGGKEMSYEEFAKLLRPNEISIEVTHACGMKCVMCSSSAEFPTPVKGEMDLKTIVRVLKEGRELGAKVVSWSGGDPILRPDFWVLAGIAHELGYKQLLYTTGIKFNGQDYEPLSDYELKLAKKYGMTLIFDLQSHNPKTHDKIFGVEGAWHMEMDVIERALNMGIPVETHFVPQRWNINDIEDYVYFLDNLGVRKVSFLRLVPQGRALENWDKISITKRQFRDMQFLFHDLLHRDDLSIRIRLGHPINFQFLVEYELTGKLPDEHGLVNGVPIDSCRGGTDAPLIRPNGDVDVCPAWKGLTEFTAGNVKHQSLKEIWRNAHTYRVFREFIHGQKYLQMKSPCVKCPFFKWCKGKCVAQRLIVAKQKYGSKPLDELILYEKDPMCWADDLGLI